MWGEGANRYKTILAHAYAFANKIDAHGSLPQRVEIMGKSIDFNRWLQVCRG
jgi:hypothetical protein